jgi:hypothetical protein
MPSEKERHLTEEKIRTDLSTIMGEKGAERNPEIGECGGEDDGETQY